MQTNSTIDELQHN